MEHTTLRYILILLTVAVIVVVALRRLRLPAVIAYLLTGLLVGPHMLGWIPDSAETRDLAEFGVVFLLFSLGLEFSLPRLIVMRRAVFVLGGAQVGLTTLGTAFMAWLFGAHLAVAIVLGGAFAMSSTAIVVKQLAEQTELGLQHGRLAVAVLLFQDLAVVPFLILIPALTHGTGAALAGALAWAFFKGLVVFAVILVLGRWVLRPVFHQIASARSTELFTIAALLITLVAAWSTAEMGLSLALGAFLAGMMLAETEFRHQVEADIRPFRDILLGLFFVTVGMLLNPYTVLRHWWLLLIVVASLLLFKTVLIAFLSRLLGVERAAALRTGLVLAQGGEFGFALLALGLSANVIRASVAEFALAVIVVSMLVSPLLIRINRVLAARIFPAGESDERDMLQHDVGQHSIQAEQHVLIVGYGRVGQNVARFLEQEDFPFVALDLDAMRVKRAREAGDPVYYGDGANPDILKAAGIGRARAVVISYFQVPTALKILRSVKELRPELPVLVRTRDDTDLDKLMAAGATEVIPETMEASLMVSAHLLHLLGMPMGRILRKVQEVRSHRYSLLRSVFRGQDALPISSGHAFREQLYTVTLDPGAHALGQTLDAINLKSVKVVVTALRREGVVGRQPAPNTVLKENDVLVLWGAPEDLETAESLLLGDIHTKPQPAKGPA